MEAKRGVELNTEQKDIPMHCGHIGGPAAAAELIGVERGRGKAEFPRMRHSREKSGIVFRGMYF